MRNVGLCFVIHSGNSKLIYDGKEPQIVDAYYWRGTIIYLELHSNKEIDPEQVLEYRADVQDEFNDMFFDTEDLNDLW